MTLNIPSKANENRDYRILVELVFHMTALLSTKIVNCYDHNVKKMN